MKGVLSKVFAVFLVLYSIFYILYSAPSAHASSQAAQAKNTVPMSSTNPDVEDNLHNWTQTVLIEVTSAFSCQLTGIDPINQNQKCLGIDLKNKKIGYVKTDGAIGFMGNMIGSLYTPPAHVSDYFQNLAANFGITKHAIAAQTGTGFDSLRPLMTIWTAFRNIVYLILVIIFVVIGLAIMLRVKIDPRTVMTVQNQIPKIIVGILAVTFSFAIAGFLIDLMWLLIYLIYNVLTQAAIDSGVKGMNEVINSSGLQSGGTPFGVLGAGNILAITGQASAGIGVLVGALVKSLFSFNSIVEFIAGNIFGGIAVGIGTAIGFIIIAIAIFIALFRVWINLIKAYVMILLDVALAPFWIIGGIIPGSPISLGGWIKDLLANLLSFPATIALFMLAIIFKDMFSNAQSQIYRFTPPLIGNPGSPSLVGSLIALGIIMMAPGITDMLKQMLKAPKSNIAGSAFGGIGAGVGTLTSGAKNVGGIASTMTYDISGKKDSAGKWGRLFQHLTR